MNKKIALFISTIFHPLFVNLLSLRLLFILYPQLAYGVQPALQFFYIGFVFVTTGLIPLVVVLILKFLGKRTSIMLHEKEERTLPYIVTASLYLFDFFLAQKAGAPVVLNAYLLACSSLVVVVLIINQFYKISIHAASMGALMAVLLCAVPFAGFDMRYVVMAGLFFSGLVCSARLFAEAHQLLQVISGFALGLLVTWFIL